MSSSVQLSKSLHLYVQLALQTTKLTLAMSTAFVDVEIPEEELSPEAVEEQEVFETKEVGTVDNPLMDFLMGGGLSQGGRMRLGRVFCIVVNWLFGEIAAH